MLREELFPRHGAPVRGGGGSGSADLACLDPRWPPQQLCQGRLGASVMTGVKAMALPGVIFILGQPQGLVQRGPVEGCEGHGARWGKPPAAWPQASRVEMRF